MLTLVREQRNRPRDRRRPRRTGRRSRYFARQLSDLDFNDRLLDLVADDDIPLLERVKFLILFSERIDEFFQVQVAGLRRQVVAGITSRALNGSTPDQLLADVRASLERMVRRQEALLLEQLDPGPGRRGHRARATGRTSTRPTARTSTSSSTGSSCRWSPRSPSTRATRSPTSPTSRSTSGSRSASRHGRHRPVRPGQDPAQRRPPAAPARGASGSSRSSRSWSPSSTSCSRAWTSGEPCVFRVTRDADLALDDDAADDLLLALQEELRRRRFLPVVRLEIDSRTSEAPVERLTEELGLGRDDVYRFAGPLGLGCLWAIHALDRPDLHDEPWTPLVPPAFTSVEREEGASIFTVLDRQDVLVHHPYDSFSASVEELMNEAAEDPHVLAIKQCLYRTSGDSPVVAALVRAAERGKQVAVLVEVTARFDEEANIGWARALEEAGAHVIYGLMGLKTHAKTTLVVRQEGDAVRLYCHVGTGNYNPKTARMYEDLGVLSSRPAARGRRHPVLQLHHRVQPAPALPGAGHLARRHPQPGGRAASTGRPRRDPTAGSPSRSTGSTTWPSSTPSTGRPRPGCPIDLIIRGICCLRPGVPGLSETVRVRSIVGRFLEHSRILRFGGAAGRPAIYYIGSADLRRRNLDRRVEAMIPVADPDAVERLEEILDTQPGRRRPVVVAGRRRLVAPDPDRGRHRHPGGPGGGRAEARRPARRVPRPAPLTPCSDGSSCLRTLPWVR